ncbi:hypothetical protein ACFLTA_06520 [Bacteroidota bacterium]
MNYKEFLELRNGGEVPDDIPFLLQAFLLEAVGDLGNASYWYSNAGKTMPDVGLDEEWEIIARELLSRLS